MIMAGWGLKEVVILDAGTRLIQAPFCQKPMTKHSVTLVNPYTNIFGALESGFTSDLMLEPAALVAKVTT